MQRCREEHPIYIHQIRKHITLSNTDMPVKNFRRILKTIPFMAKNSKNCLSKTVQKIGFYGFDNISIRKNPLQLPKTWFKPNISENILILV